MSRANPANRERFTVRVVINVAVEGTALAAVAATNPDRIGLALALAEVVSAQTLVQGTAAAATPLPSKIEVRRARAAKDRKA